MLTKMGADIRGIGSNVLWVTGKDELGGCTHDVGPDHIEIGSFMALAGVTGGELRIRDCEPDDLRMIRLVFRRIGLHTELDGADVVVPGGQKLIASRDVGEFKAKVQDGPWPAFPADLTSIALALATQCEGSVLIHEWMFENRLVFTDKLVLMGARHHPVRPAPRDRLGAVAAARRARRVARHPRRHGDAHRRRCAPTAAARSATSARSTAATSASTSACGTSARASSACPASRSRSRREAVIHPLPSGTRDVLPDEMRELRAITEAPARRLRPLRLRRGLHAGDRVRGGAQPRRRRPAAGLPRLRRPRRGPGAAPGHDRADRARRRDPLRRAPSRRCASATSPTPTARCARTAGRCASSCRPASSSSARPGRPARPRPSPCSAPASTRWGCGPPASAWARPRCTRRSWTRTGSRRPPGRGCWRSSATRASSALEEEVRTLDLPAAAAEELVRVPQLRGGPEVLERVSGTVHDAADGLRDVLGRLDARVAAPGASSTSASPAGWATTPAPSSTSTTRPSARRSAAAGATTSSPAASGATCPRSGSPSTSTACTSPWPGRSA